MNKISRFPGGKAVPLWHKAVLAFIGAVVAAQIGIWQYRDYRAAQADPAAAIGELISAPAHATPKSVQAAATGDREIASFGFCHEGGGTNCVVDGDTLYYHGTKIRIADIDTPETHEPRCPEEAALGATATQRMHALINAGPFTLQPIDRDEDPYGRKLRIVTRGGQSLGGVLVNEGLARWYEGGRRPWC